MMNHAGVILEQISDRYLLSIKAHRQSVLLRSSCKFEGSSNALRTALNLTTPLEYDTQITIDPRLNAQLSKLRNSLAKNNIQANNLAHAEEEMYKWEPLSPSSPSFMEVAVNCSRSIVLGRILRFKSCFGEAVRYFEALSKGANTVEY